jgi:hypothetical protein
LLYNITSISGDFLFMGMIYGSNNYTTDGRKKKTSSARRTRQTIKGVRSNAPEPYRRQAPEYRSAPDTTGVAARLQPMYYTGTLVKGIGTMHKSNAVPVINEEEMKDLARMRR